MKLWICLLLLSNFELILGQRQQSVAVKCKVIEVSGSETGRYNIGTGRVLIWKSEVGNKIIFSTGGEKGWRIGKRSHMNPGYKGNGLYNSK